MTPTIDVLVVDDSQIILLAVQGVLEQAGYSVETCDSPFEVPRMIRELKPRLVLLDVTMPAVEGDRVVSVVRAYEGAGRRAKIVLFSDRGEDELRRRAARCGADGFLAKTADMELLVREVGALLEDA